MRHGFTTIAAGLIVAVMIFAVGLFFRSFKPSQSTPIIPSSTTSLYPPQEVVRQLPIIRREIVKDSQQPESVQQLLVDASPLKPDKQSIIIPIAVEEKASEEMKPVTSGLLRAITEQPIPSPKQLAAELPQIRQEAQRQIIEAKIPQPQRLLQKIQSISAPSTFVPEQVGDFFKQFDFNNDGALSIDEAVAFYYWIKRNIKYRFDDETIISAPKGVAVGDGRIGPDYRQRPFETITERFGDCEDTATLEVAFYNYYGIPAYVAGVNAQDSIYVDHALAIVRIEGDLNDFVDLLGTLMYWNFKPGQEIIAWGGITVPSGNYMLIDNAYSRNFGYLTSGVQQDKFNIQIIAPVDAPYDAAWERFIDQINLVWTN